VSGEGNNILGAKIVENVGGRGSARKPAGELTTLPRPTSCWEWVADPPQVPQPALGLRPFGLALF